MNTMKSWIVSAFVALGTLLATPSIMAQEKADGASVTSTSPSVLIVDTVKNSKPTGNVQQQINEAQKGLDSAGKVNGVINDILKALNDLIENSNLKNAGNVTDKVGKTIKVAGLAINVHEIVNAYLNDDRDAFINAVNKVVKKALVDIAKKEGAKRMGRAGLVKGVERGFEMGLVEGGIGALPGAVIGGIIGGVGGYVVGGAAAKKIAEKIYQLHLNSLLRQLVYLIGLEYKYEYH